MYKLTVIVPSYNNGIYMRQCLDSIMEQDTTFEYHIIIADDASTDGSQDIIKEYEERYAGMITTVYSEVNEGLFSNVLKALEIMDTEYYCVLDPDDYWTNRLRLQKAVDFLDANPTYTIYATNLDVLCNDGTKKLKYNVGSVKEKTSTYEDYLNGNVIFSCTPASTYRNVCFNNGVPKEFADLKGTLKAEAFRADTARNLMHIRKGKLYFLNEVTAECRYNGKGLFSGTSMAERYIQSAYAHSCYYEYFGREYKNEYVGIVSELYTQYLKCIYKSMIDGEIANIREKYRKYACSVEEWLKNNSNNEIKDNSNKIRFSLISFASIFDKKTVAWGTGTGAVDMLTRYGISSDRIAYYVDNNPSRQGDMFLGKEIKAPEVLKKEAHIVVIIVSSYADEIIEQIRKDGLCRDEDIVNLYDYDRYWC